MAVAAGVGVGVGGVVVAEEKEIVEVVEVVEVVEAVEVVEVVDVVEVVAVVVVVVVSVVNQATKPGQLSQCYAIVVTGGGSNAQFVSAGSVWVILCLRAMERGGNERGLWQTHFGFGKILVEDMTADESR